MDWRKYWNDLAVDSSNPFLQVARVGKKVDFSEELINRTVEHIIANLDLQMEDVLLDVCCGNGMISILLSKKCAAVTGCDISEELIRLAKENHANSKVKYLAGDATQLTSFINTKFDKINLFFSFQYLDSYSKGFSAIREMSQLLKPNGRIFLGDVPDYEFLSRFYPSYPARLKYLLKLRLGKSEMGKFWKEAEIARICGELGLTYQRLLQPEDLPYSAYRVDYMLQKQT